MQYYSTHTLYLPLVLSMARTTLLPREANLYQESWEEFVVCLSHTHTHSSSSLLCDISAHMWSCLRGNDSVFLQGWSVQSITVFLLCSCTEKHLPHISLRRNTTQIYQPHIWYWYWHSRHHDEPLLMSGNSLNVVLNSREGKQKRNIMLLFIKMRKIKKNQITFKC